LIGEWPDLDEVQGAFARDGVELGRGSIWRYIQPHRLSVKRTAHANEQEHPEVAGLTLAA
jgi:hypothetical protein